MVMPVEPYGTQQREALECLGSLSRDQQNKVQSLALEVENGAARLAVSVGGHTSVSVLFDMLYLLWGL